MGDLIYAVGDVHGCYDQLLAAVGKIGEHAKARPCRVVFLGDYVDRGPKSREVVRLVQGLVAGEGTRGQWLALKGNHEDMMIAAGADRRALYHWYDNGGDETEASYAGFADERRQHLNWLASLPTMIETENHIFVHAGLSARYSLSEQPEEVLLWIRGWEKDDHDFGKHVVYGHTPRNNPVLRPYSTGLDTGACFGGPLTIGVFDAAAKTGPVDILQVW